MASILMIGSILAAILASKAVASPCDDEISRLMPCYSYIEGSSKPASDCCSHLSEVAEAKPECLCQGLHSDNNLNTSRVMGLPKACNVTTPPANLCNSSKNMIDEHIYRRCVLIMFIGLYNIYVLNLRINVSIDMISH